MSRKRENAAVSDVTRKVPEVTKIELCARTAGRCEFAGCNKYVFEHHLTRRPGNFGQLAHIVAFSDNGPRAGAASGTAAVHSISNLMLLCPTCHKHVDDNEELFPVELLKAWKKSHESRIELVTGLGPDMQTAIVQLKANIGGQPVGIPAPHVYEAVAPRYPRDTIGFVIDLTSLNAEDASFYTSAQQLMERRIEMLFAPGMEPQETRHISLFALVRIPLHLSAESGRT